MFRVSGAVLRSNWHYLLWPRWRVAFRLPAGSVSRSLGVSCPHCSTPDNLRIEASKEKLGGGSEKRISHI